MSQYSYDLRVFFDGNTSLEDIVTYFREDQVDWSYCLDFKRIYRDEEATVIPSRNSCAGRDFSILSKSFPSCLFEVVCESLSDESFTKEVWFSGELILVKNRDLEEYDEDDEPTYTEWYYLVEDDEGNIEPVYSLEDSNELIKEYKDSIVLQYIEFMDKSE